MQLDGRAFSVSYTIICEKGASAKKPLPQGSRPVAWPPYLGDSVLDTLLKRDMFKFGKGISLVGKGWSASSHAIIMLSTSYEIGKFFPLVTKEKLLSYYDLRVPLHYTA